jgi:hypothetical protein
MKEHILHRAMLVVLSVFILNLAGSFFSWYTAIPWYDKFMHVIGGVWLGLMAGWFLFSCTLSEKKFWIYALLLVFAGTLGWEAMEYIVQYVTGAGFALATPVDSVFDIIFGILGSCIGIWYVILKKKEIL